MVEMVGVVWVVEVDRVAGVFEVAEVAGVVHHVGPVHRGIYLKSRQHQESCLLSIIEYIEFTLLDIPDISAQHWNYDHLDSGHTCLNDRTLCGRLGMNHVGYLHIYII